MPGCMVYVIFTQFLIPVIRAIRVISLWSKKRLVHNPEIRVVHFGILSWNYFYFYYLVKYLLKFWMLRRPWVHHPYSRCKICKHHPNRVLQHQSELVPYFLLNSSQCRFCIFHWSTTIFHPFQNIHHCHSSYVSSKQCETLSAANRQWCRRGRRGSWSE